MTERPLQITTQGATPIQTGFNSATSISANDAHTVSESVDEEPYTIKCICNFDEDDGNTIYCESCDTWQHIECFYPGRVADASRADFDHSCADCKPRSLDRRHAIDHQQSRQNKASIDSSDKKSKRPPPKSHKKKSKPSDLQVNGYHDHDGRRNGSPQEHHPKKSKGHRSNQSISSQAKRSPPYNPRPQSHGHPPSPAHTPPDLPSDFQVHSYSEHFLTLYDNDDNVQITHNNSHASLAVTNTLPAWLQDPEKLQEDVGAIDVFQFLKVSPDTLDWPELTVVPRKDTLEGVNLRWKSLVTPDALKESGRLAELNGLVGFQKDYCSDPDNRWQEYVHPKPFIFFHPRLPLFIDTRNEGSISRYVRRSCRPNTNLETFIANKVDYHFWLVTDRPLAANEQITIPWDFRFPSSSRSRFLHLLNLGDEDGAPFDGAEITEEEYQQLSNVIDLVLSDYGGCACDLGSDCSFARFHRNYHGRSHTQSNGVKSKKGRKPKQNHVSPTSTGHATNSRAASEGQQEQYDEDDRRSVSGSSRSKPNSRDMTPLHGVVEVNSILTETSDREKRKLAMVEENFRKMEDKQGQPARKKKRASDGSTTNIPTNSTTPQPSSKPRQKSVAPRMSISQAHTPNTNGSRARQYVDASTSRPQSGSPFSAISPTQPANFPGHPASRQGSATYRSRQSSTTPRSIYTDSSTQTDHVENAWYSSTKQSPVVKRSIIPLSKRLLKNRQKLKLDLQAQHNAATFEHNQSAGNSPSISMDLDTVGLEDRSHPASPTDARGRRGSIASSTPSVDVSGSADVIMSDAPTILLNHPKKPPPPQWAAATAGGSYIVPVQKSPDLRVQMPPMPSFATPNMSGTLSGSVTPSSAAGSIAQSPFGTPHFPGSFLGNAINGVAHASPVKTTKKLSLSDYKLKMNAKKTETSRPSAGSSPTVIPATLKPSLSTIEEAKDAGVLEGSAIIESPTIEKRMDPMDSIGAHIESPVKSNLPSGQPNGAL
jgi:hypothetical protein